jgi:hypothetical protein
MKNALMLAVLLTLVVILGGVSLRATHGQSAGTARVMAGKVVQGQILYMDVELDKASNLSGEINVAVSSDAPPNVRLNLSCGLNEEQTKCQATVRVPLDVQVGKWAISEITFIPLGGVPKVLAKHGDSSFEVVPHGVIVLPDSATISDVK